MQYPLSPWLSLEKNISDTDYAQMISIMEHNDLSRYLIEKGQCYLIKDGDKIAAFGRLFEIGENQGELWSLRVDEQYRWHKLWLAIAESLIHDKQWDKQIYLATRRTLWPYYEKLWFQIITKNIPGKLIHTGKWAQEHGIDFIIMQYE